MKTVHILLLCCVIALSACNRNSGNQPATSPQSTVATQPKAAPGECIGAIPDITRGYVHITSADTKGSFDSCSFATATGGVVAFNAKGVGNSGVSLIVLSFQKTGTANCGKDSPVAMNYRTPDGMLFAANGDRYGKCKITTTTFDDKHWTGSATARLVPAGKDTGKAGVKPIDMKLDWKLEK